MSAPPLAIAAVDEPRRWHWPVVLQCYDTKVTIGAAEKRAIEERGTASLRRLCARPVQALAHLAAGWVRVSACDSPATHSVRCASTA